MQQVPESQNMNSETFPSKYTYSTLAHMPKDNLIEYIRLLEKNCYSAEKMNEQQAKNCEELLKQADAKIAELNAYIARLEDPWTSVEDGLPMDSLDVLIYNKRGITIGDCQKYGNRAHWTGRQGRSHSLCTVTHWAPLPKPPKKKNSF